MKSEEAEKIYDVAVVGAGPAGYGAALYTCRARLDTVVFAGPEPGGQLMLTTDVENYPGFSEGVKGPKLMAEMMQQARRFGAEMRYETVEDLQVSRKPFVLQTEKGKYRARAVILAMGAKARMLEIGEERFLGKGVSTCAVCDAAFYEDGVVYVVGGGDAACEDSLALSKYARQVKMLVRRDELRASKIMQERVKKDEKIEILWNSEVREVEGEESLERIVVENNQTKEKKKLEADGLFLAIGHIPATEFLQDTKIKMDKKNYILSGLGLSEGGVKMARERLKDGLVSFPTMTSVEGVFAAGDVVDFRWQQAVSAAGMGVMAALDAEWWLGEEKA